jgi:hypothetical protein
MSQLHTTTTVVGHRIGTNEKHLLGLFVQRKAKQDSSDEEVDATKDDSDSDIDFL